MGTNGFDLAAVLLREAQDTCINLSQRTGILEQS